MATKMSHVRKVYEFENGERGRSAKPDWTALHFELLGTGKDADGKAVVVDTVTVERSGIVDDIAACAVGHGLSQKLGDDLSGIAKKADADGASFDETNGFAAYIRERLEAMLDNFSNGVWVAEGEGATGSGNVTILLEAMVRVFEAAGKDLSDEQLATIRNNLKDEDYRKGVKARPDVDKHVKAIQLERAQARLAAAENAAENADTGGLDDLLA